jgi:uncharacterized protein
MMVNNQHFGQPKRVAVIGSGIAGNGAAYLLKTSTHHSVTVFEQDNRPGGHSATIDVPYNGGTLAVDTGFIVYNEANYPELSALFDHLGVKTQPSNMSFSLSVDHGRFEWSGRSNTPVLGLFAQPKNLISPTFLRMLYEIGRFNRLAMADLFNHRLTDESLEDYLVRNQFSKRFQDDYLLPMGAAIWSMSTQSMLKFPVKTFIAFFNNHHLLRYTGHQWRTVTGGSREYVTAMVKTFQDDLRCNTAVQSVQRNETSVRLVLADGTASEFDSVIMACHSDQALALLSDPSPEERQILGAITYKPNTVFLHADPKLMPLRKQAWASWNVLKNGGHEEDLCITYWMNQLQSLDRDFPLFVTLNPANEPSPKLTYGKFVYGHPQFDSAAISAQTQLTSIQGVNRTWFCGAWTGNGFHEDGLASAMRVTQDFGASPIWRATSAYSEAAE